MIATNTTPLILLNPQGKIEITGKCIPENSAEFWERVQEWFSDYVKIQLVTLP
ncbi:MAG: SiaC family regulatory phosphoprotein [Crocinitomicaceae bacterium]